MFRFFRKIRLKELDSGDIRKYLLYATGEILLVVIGILLALQLNNMSQKAQRSKEAVKALNNYNQDLKNDLIQLESLTNITKQNMLEIDSLFMLLNDPQNASLEKVMKYNLQVPYVNYFDENRGTYEESISTGKISYIKTDSLREEIFDYYRFVQQNRTDANYIKFIEDIVSPQWGAIVIPTQQGLNYLGFESQLPPLDIYQLANNKKYIQLIAQKYGVNQVQIKDWNVIANHAKSLKKLVAAELEKFH